MVGSVGGKGVAADGMKFVGMEDIVDADAEPALSERVTQAQRGSLQESVLQVSAQQQISGRQGCGVKVSDEDDGVG